MKKGIILLFGLVLLAAGCRKEPQTAEADKTVGEAVASAGEAVGEAVSNAGEAVGDAVDATVEKTGELASDAGEAIGDAVEKTGELASDAGEAVGDAVGAAVEKTGEVASNAAEAVGDAVEKTGEVASNAAEAVGEGVEKAVDKTGEVASNVGEAVGDAAEKAVDKTGEVASNAAEAVGDAVEKTGEVASNVGEAVGDATEKAVEKTGEAITAALPELRRPDPQKPEGDNNAVPRNWKVRLDTPNPEAVISADAEAADIFFVNMTPGWHITTGPAGVFYHPGSTAEGSYVASVDMNLFDPGDRNEAFGMIFGGQNLDDENQTYDYFLIRNSGEFLIKRRVKDDTQLIQDWTASDAIVKYANTGDSSVLNKLSIQVGDSDVSFVINDKVVATHPKSHVNTDGIVGVRVNHALNVHVSNLSVN